MKAKRITIFIVDDSEITLETLKRELEESLNCQVKTYTSAEECIRNLNLEPDIILSDYYLDSEYSNKMNGDQMLSRIKKLHPNLPVIMYSSKNSFDVVLRLMKLGATDFIAKENDFFKRIREVSLKQVKRIKDEYEDSVTKRNILIACLLLTIIVFLFQSYLPDALPLFMICLYAIGCVWLFMGSKRASKNKGTV